MAVQNQEVCLFQANQRLGPLIVPASCQATILSILLHRDQPCDWPEGAFGSTQPGIVSYMNEGVSTILHNFLNISSVSELFLCHNGCQVLCPWWQRMCPCCKRGVRCSEVQCSAAGTDAGRSADQTKLHVPLQGHIARIHSALCAAFFCPARLFVLPPLAFCCKFFAVQSPTCECVSFIPHPLCAHLTETEAWH